MKKNLLVVIVALLSAGLLAQEQIEVHTGAGYANDVYYNLQSGTITTVQRDNWDIAFVTQVMSVSVLANNGSGVELYTYKGGDIDDWATVDTTGIAWTPMYNSIETWDVGAFNANTIPGDDFDYGWGRYNMTTHTITGDSIFILKTLSDSIKKVAIVQKSAMMNTWEFKYANLDGSNEQVVPLNAADYIDKYFIHYSIDSTKFVDREPAMDDWDLLFTKYYDYTIPYIVTGVLINDDHVMAQEVRESGMDQAAHSTYEESAFNSNISMIGYDWKKLNASYSYDIIDTVVYYIKSYGETDSAYYKLYFTDFSGSMGGGIYTFMQEHYTFVSAEEHQLETLLEVYPNPASDHINVVFDFVGHSEIDIIDITGRLVRTTQHDASGFTNISMDLSSLNPGVFFIRVSAAGESNVLRFIKE